MKLRKPLGSASLFDPEFTPARRTDFTVDQRAGVDLLHGVIRKFSAGELFLDQYQQLESIEGIKVKIVFEVRFIRYLFGINT
jgi:hypothetical protein